MIKQIALLLCILTSVLQATTYQFKKQKFSDEDVSKLVTLITCVTPDLSKDGREKFYNSQASLYGLSEYTQCKRILLFKDPAPDSIQEVGYEEYMKEIRNLTYYDPVFRGVDMIVSPPKQNVSGLIEEAMKSVTTPFIFVHFSEWEFTKPFDLVGALATLASNPFIKYIFFSPFDNRDSTWSGPVDEHVRLHHFVPLTRSFGWSSSKSHLTSTQYYREKILPVCRNTDIEPQLFRNILNTYKRFGRGLHAVYGVYIYGDMDDGNYLIEATTR